jgi:hypothetical protein
LLFLTILLELDLSKETLANIQAFNLAILIKGKEGSLNMSLIK